MKTIKYIVCAILLLAAAACRNGNESMQGGGNGQDSNNTAHPMPAGAVYDTAVSGNTGAGSTGNNQRGDTTMNTGNR